MSKTSRPAKGLCVRSLAGACLLPLLFLTLAACTVPPPLDDAAPPLPPGEARLFFYRHWDSGEAPDWTTVSLNGQEIGASGPDTVFFHDVPPGTYRITVRSASYDPNQAKVVKAAAGDIYYVEIRPIERYVNSEASRYDIFDLRLESPAAGRDAVRGLHYLPG